MRQVRQGVAVSSILALSIAFAMPVAHAAGFTSSAAFNLATTGLTSENFSAYSPGTLVPDGSTLGVLQYSFSTAAVLGGVITDMYTSFSGNLGNSLAAKQVPGPLDPLDFFYSNEDFTVTFPNPVTAVGIFSNTNLPVDATLTTSSGGLATTWTVYDTFTFGFLGFTSATPFISATFTSSDYNIPLIEYGAAAGATTPEASTWAMLLAGFMSLAYLACRQDKRIRLTAA